MTVKIPAAELYKKVVDDIFIVVDPGDIGDISDGYHTFDDLYQHWMVLTLALMRLYPERSWRSKLYAEGDNLMFEGFFIAGMTLPTGQISYHYKLEHWRRFEGVHWLAHAPKWDGHTPEDVVIRLMKWVRLV